MTIHNLKFQGKWNVKDVKNIKVGDTIDMRGPSSWSSSESVAKHFQDASLVRKGKEKILFVDKTKDRDAMPYLLSSHIDAQREVLYADVPFKVKSIEKGDHSYVIEVEQER